MSARLSRKQSTSSDNNRPRPAQPSAPSGIAQLRSQSADKQAQHDLDAAKAADSMNLDDFIVPSSVASPAGISHSPVATDDLTSATAPAIPIRKQTQLDDGSLHISRASAPSVPPALGRDNEFGYVQRHVRKTSIDERRVSRFYTVVHVLAY